MNHNYVKRSIFQMALPITMYGATHCEDTAAARAHLQNRHISFHEVDIDHDAEAERFVIFINGGMRITPTIVFGESKLKLVLSDPTQDELDELLPPKSKDQDA
jgi:mycoredoxin